VEVQTQTCWMREGSREKRAVKRLRVVSCQASGVRQ
jgi:hypothetical protein